MSGERDTGSSCLVRERPRLSLEARVTTPVVWLIAAVLVAIGGVIVLRVHHAVRTGEQRLLDRVAVVAGATHGPLPHVAGIDLAIVSSSGRVLDGRLRIAIDRRELVLAGRPGGARVLLRGATTVALRPARRAGQSVVIAASSRLPEADQSRLVAIEAEGLIPIGFVALGLALIGFERAARRHRRRLERLGQVAEQLDRGDLEARTGERAGDELGGVGVRLDVLADNLQTLERSRGTMLSQVSHDLRSPLALIRAYAWTLRKGELSETRSDRLLTIEEEAQSMSFLIDDLLLLGRRSAAAPVEGEPDSAEIGALAERVVARRVAKARDEGLTLALVLPTGPAMVAIRGGGLERIVGNLVENAIRHAASRVTVRIEIDADEVVLSCEDDGPGIPPDEMQHLFEPFWRGATRSGASGLGLAIARDLAESSGGAISAENVESGGARLVVRLPRARSLVGGAA
jgi:signal transduction histidine kinase